MNLRPLTRFFAVLLMSTSALLALPVHATDETADALISRLSAEVLSSIQTHPTMQSGDVASVIALVDAKIMPNMDFKRMTASAVGPTWRQTTPEQQQPYFSFKLKNTRVKQAYYIHSINPGLQIGRTKKR